ncbi:hypothetical protein [Rhodococcus sp. As11]|uniref:hypothetical protein n=1 Tax=Rhodococcus sp. As11 TaxID=3029189 RepID=UPI003B7A1BE8
MDQLSEPVLVLLMFCATIPYSFVLFTGRDLDPPVHRVSDKTPPWEMTPAAVADSIALLNRGELGTDEGTSTVAGH